MRVTNAVQQQITRQVLRDLERFGWICVEGAVPVRLCERLVEVLEAEMGVPLHDQLRWQEYGGEPHDLVPIWGHQAQWDIRQHPDLHRIWATLWKTDRLRVWLRFLPLHTTLETRFRRAAGHPLGL
jgi:hypothetical protein